MSPICSGTFKSAKIQLFWHISNFMPQFSAQKPFLILLIPFSTPISNTHTLTVALICFFL